MKPAQERKPTGREEQHFGQNTKKAYETIRGTGEKIWPDEDQSNVAWIYINNQTTGNVYLCSAPQNTQSFSYSDLNK